MTEYDLSTLLRDHITETEPVSLLDAERSITWGRRTLVRRRARRGLAAATLLGAAAVAIPALMSHDVLPQGDRGGVDKLTAAALSDYDASAMPQKLTEAAGPIISRTVPGIADSAAFEASDSQSVRLPEEYWDKASGMELTYGGSSDHRFRVSLQHSGSEAEGNARKNCENEVELGYAFTCDVTRVDGDVVTTRVMAARKMDGPPGSTDWGAVTRDELRTGHVIAGDPSQRPIKSDEIYFMRITKSVHSTTFLTVAQETVKAPTFAAAQAAFAVPTADLIDLATDPTLVIPRPPIGKNGCAWMLHPEGVTCAVKAP